MAITQANRLLSLATPLPYNQLVVNRLSAQEGISQLFQIELEMLHAETQGDGPPFTVDPKKIIGQPMSVAVVQKEGSTEVKRHFHGICVSFAQGNRTARWTKYQAVVVPRAWMLTQIKQSRIFQQKSVPDILRAVFTGLDTKWKLEGTYEPRNYCVQYRESDWDFASRLMEEEGIFYFFEHTENGHKLVVADMPSAHVDCPSKHKIEFAVDRSSEQEDWAGSILSWRVDDRVRTGKYTLWDHTFELPGKDLEAVQVSLFDIGGNRALEVYDYPGEYAQRFDGVDPSGGERSSDVGKVFLDNKRTVKIRQQEIDVNYKNFFGTSDCCSLQPGFRFELTKHKHVDYNAQYVIVSMRTEAVQFPAYVSDELVPEPYTVSLVALPYGSSAAPFRPQRRTPKPIVHGSQTAVVVGPPGEEIFVDKYGRVKVQFNWDRQGQKNDKSSCWLRVAQMWAGKKWGTMFIPRIGMEVLVDFLEGDPDQPIIVGCVYNADNMPPYALPDNKTRSTIKTNSSKSGGGFNEIRFEDKKGEEQIFIHAEKNQDIRVKNDKMEWIGNDRHLIVGASQKEKVGGDKHLNVTGNQIEKFGGSVGQTIGGSQDVKISQKFAVDAGREVHIKAGVTSVIEAGTQLTLKVGGNFISLDPSGVTIQGTMVKLNSGGAAGSGSGASPDSPAAPKEADTDQAGQQMQVAAAKAPPAPPQFSLLANLVRSGADGPAVMAALAQAQTAAQAQVEQGIQSAQNTVAAVQQQAAGAAAAAMAAAQSKFDEVKNKVDELADKAKSKFDEAKELANDLKNKAEDLADKALAMAEEAKAKMEEVEAEIRSAVDSAVQAAQEKVAEAEKALEEAKQKAEEAVQEAKDAAEAAVADARAAVNDAKQQAEAAAQQAEQAFDDAKQQAEAAAEAAKEKLEEAKQQAEQAVEDAKQQVEAAKQEAAQQVEAAQQKVEEAKQQVEQAAQEAQQQAEQAVADAKQQAEEVKQQAEQAVAETKQQAEQAIDETKQQAEQAIQGAQQQAEQAIDDAAQAAQEVSQQASQALQGAKDAIPFM